MNCPQYTPTCSFAQLDHPPPFDPAQLQHVQAGCPDCLDHLVRQNEGLVHWVIRHHGSDPLSYEEALQAGRIGLWKALLRFDPDRGTAFSSYAVVAIRRHIQREAQCLRRFWRPLPNVPPTPLPDPLDEARRRILLPAVQRWVAQLSPRRAYVVWAYYGLDGAPPQIQRTIAQSLGVTRQRVQQLLAEARLLLALPIYSWEIRLLLECTSKQEVRTALKSYYRFCRKRRSP